MKKHIKINIYILLISFLISFQFLPSAKAQNKFSTLYDDHYEVIDLITNQTIRFFPYVAEHKYRPNIISENGYCFVGTYDSVDDHEKYPKYEWAGHSKICCYDNNGNLLMNDVDAIDAIVPQNKEKKIVVFLQGAQADAGPVIVTSVGVKFLETGEESVYHFESTQYFRRDYYSDYLSYNLSDNHIYVSLGQKLLRFDSYNMAAGYEVVGGGLIHSDNNVYSANPGMGVIYKNGEYYDKVDEIYQLEVFFEVCWIKGTNTLFCPPYVYNADKKEIKKFDFHYNGTISYYDRETQILYTNCRIPVRIEDFIPASEIP